METVFWKRFQRCFVHHGDGQNIQKNEVHEGIFSDFSNLCLEIWFFQTSPVFTQESPLLHIATFQFHVSWHQFFPGVSRQTCQRWRSDPAKSWCQNETTFPNISWKKTTSFLYFGTYFLTICSDLQGYIFGTFFF